MGQTSPGCQSNLSGAKNVWGEDAVRPQVYPASGTHKSHAALGGAWLPRYHRDPQVLPLPRNATLSAATRERCFGPSRPLSRQKHRGCFHRGKDRRARRRSPIWFATRAVPRRPTPAWPLSVTKPLTYQIPGLRSALTRGESATRWYDGVRSQPLGSSAGNNKPSQSFAVGQEGLFAQCRQTMNEMPNTGAS